MFEGIAGTQKALIILAAVMSLGFTFFTALAVVPLVRAIRELLKMQRSICAGMQRQAEQKSEVTASAVEVPHEPE